MRALQIVTRPDNLDASARLKHSLNDILLSARYTLVQYPVRSIFIREKHIMSMYQDAGCEHRKDSQVEMRQIISGSNFMGRVG